MSQVAKSKDNLAKCQCMKCPTYTMMCKMLNMPGNVISMMGDVAEKEHIEAMYCAFNKSKCIAEEKGCMCGQCLVHAENNLDKGYYCLVTSGK